MEGLALLLCVLCVLLSVLGVVLLLAAVACHHLLASSCCIADGNVCDNEVMFLTSAAILRAKSAASTDPKKPTQKSTKAAQVVAPLQAAPLQSPNAEVPRKRGCWFKEEPAALSSTSSAAAFSAQPPSPTAAVPRRRARWFADAAQPASAASCKLDELQQLLKKGWGGHISHVLPRGFCMLPDGVEAAYPSKGWELGRGGFGRVYMAQERRSGQEVAVKVVDKMEMRSMGHSLHPLRMELRGMLAMRGHLHAVQLLAVHEDRRYLSIVMESCEFGSLADFMHSPFVKRMTEQQRVELFLGVLSAVEVAHGHGLIHCDIKPDNILVCRAESSQPGCPKVVLKLADWGCSVQLRKKGESTMKLPFGTDGYMPPEMRRMWSGECRWGQYGQKVDVYAAGMSLWEFLEAAEGSSQESTDLIEAMLAAKPRNRLNSSSALQQATEITF